MTERKLATIQLIAEIKEIEGADTIEAVRINGWWVVAKKGEYKVNDFVIYCEIDSWIPTEIASFLSKGKDPREYNGVKGERLRTARLRGQISQGLVLDSHLVSDKIDEIHEGQDVTELLGIQKWEPPVTSQMQGLIKGWFPSFIRKTDQERVQNLVKELRDYNMKGYHWEVTEKLDGSSMTVYLKNGVVGVCSRNLDLKEDENNSFWKVANQYELKDRMTSLCGNLAIQGELVGEGIQGNPYKLKGQDFYVFDVFHIDSHRYYGHEARQELCELLGLKHVPVVQVTGDSFVLDCEDLLEYAEGKSVLYDKAEREGLVFKCVSNPDISFKAISNKFLLKEK